MACHAIRRLPDEMVGVRGFEPPTPASRTQYSTRLSYTPTDAGSHRRPAFSKKIARREFYNGIWPRMDGS